MSDFPKVTLKDIAIQVGISTATVSRALAGHPGISDETRNRVLESATQLGYKKNKKLEYPRGNNKNLRGVVGVVVAALHNAFYPYLVDWIHDELDAQGFDTILIVDEVFGTGNSRKIETLIDASIDGVIYATASIGSSTVDFLVERKIPTVLVIRSNKRENVDIVESDNNMIGVEAINHLLELGHRRIGFIMGPKNTSTSLDRYVACIKELKKANINPPEDWVVWGSYSHDHGYSGIVSLMNSANLPTAVFCANDLIAIGALDACHKFGIKVPEDVSIIGVDDIPMASWSIIGLTTVRQSIREIGRLSAQRIVTRIRGEPDDSIYHDILPTSIVRRGTTAPPK